MNLWRNTDGNLVVGTNGNPILCDDCPCVDDCPVSTTSFVVSQTNLGTDVFTPTTVTRTAWPWIACDSPAGVCVWSGLVTGGSFAGKIVAVHGTTPSNWFVTFRNPGCPVTGSFTGTDLGQVNPPGNYSNGYTVT